MKGLCALRRAFGLRLLSIDHHFVQGWEMAYLKLIERALSYVNLILVQGGDQYSIARLTSPPF